MPPQDADVLNVLDAGRPHSGPFLRCRFPHLAVDIIGRPVSGLRQKRFKMVSLIPTQPDVFTGARPSNSGKFSFNEKKIIYEKLLDSAGLWADF